VIGSSRYHGYNRCLSEVEIGWTFLAGSYWGGTYNGEVKRLMLRHAFQYVERVVFSESPSVFIVIPLIYYLFTTWPH
jgi:N-acetyltransferase